MLIITYRHDCSYKILQCKKKSGWSTLMLFRLRVYRGGVQTKVQTSPQDDIFLPGNTLIWYCTVLYRTVPKMKF